MIRNDENRRLTENAIMAHFVNSLLLPDLIYMTKKNDKRYVACLVLLQDSSQPSTENGSDSAFS
jgi:hypothetical protein